MEKIKEQVSKAQIESNIRLVLGKITEVVADKNYVLKVDGHEVSHIEYLNITLDHLTQSGMKKLAKKIAHALNKNGMKSLNNFLWYLKLKGIVNSKAKLEYSAKENEIRFARNIYKNLAKEIEAARLKYLETKGDFYKK